MLFENVSPARRALMARIGSRDTRPEILVRQALHARGFRFRLHRRDLPGTPDIVLPRYRVAVLVHGCFWHQHAGCRSASRPRTRRSYWGPKLAANARRDEASAAALAALGWKVEVIWECETLRPGRLAGRIDRLVAAFRAEAEAMAEVARQPREGAPAFPRQAAALIIPPESTDQTALDRGPGVAALFP